MTRDIEWGDMYAFDDDGNPISPAARALNDLPPLELPPGQRVVDLLDHELDYMALVEAYVERERYPHSEVGAYWRRTAELLEQLLDVSLDTHGVSPPLRTRCETHRTARPADRRKIAEWSAAQRAPEQVSAELCRDALEAARLHHAISPPFQGRLEGLPHPIVRDFEGRHRATFRELGERLRRACMELIADVLRTLDPEVVHRRVRKTQLFDRGLDWSPPEVDFL